VREAWRAARDRERAASVSIAPAAAAPLAIATPDAVSRRASICVMPFVDKTSGDAKRGGLADGLADDIITRLAKAASAVRDRAWQRVRLGDRNVGPEEAGRMLNVDYVASGSVRRHQNRLFVVVELTETRTARVVWAEDFDYPIDDAFLALHEIGNRIVASIAEEIETAERNRAISQVAELTRRVGGLSPRVVAHVSLQWGRQRPGGAFFRQSVQMDPTFARAYAGLSFTHFQNAFCTGRHNAPSTSTRRWRQPAAASWSTIAILRPTGPWPGAVAARTPG